MIFKYFIELLYLLFIGRPFLNVNDFSRYIPYSIFLCPLLRNSFFERHNWKFFFGYEKFFLGGHKKIENGI